MVKNYKTQHQMAYDAIMHGWPYAEPKDLANRLTAAQPILAQLDPSDIRHTSYQQIQAQHKRDHEPAVDSKRRK